MRPLQVVDCNVAIDVCSCKEIVHRIQGARLVRDFHELGRVKLSIEVTVEVSQTPKPLDRSRLRPNVTVRWLPRELRADDEKHQRGA